jgi:hypothetical protein
MATKLREDNEQLESARHECLEIMSQDIDIVGENNV